jgi:hypothetical protein
MAPRHVVWHVLTGFVADIFKALQGPRKDARAAVELITELDQSSNTTKILPDKPLAIKRALT